MLPIVACTTFGLYTSAQSSLQMICWTPNQSAVRMIVPRFPGSCIVSSTNETFCLTTGSLTKNFFTTATTWLAVVNWEILSNSCWLIISTTFTSLTNFPFSFNHGSTPNTCSITTLDCCNN